uniref:Reducing polyketide synthase DEP5 n=1 Tax=Alternaria brassicicola TaxID=29001 RepID=DEP5_ALTBR|nr:RecName: Full=Reducing polyketide synthase DEP5; AltName: Full=Depudecin biosynthesis cluster protein 1 [Alternaria brassicicola]ACZ57548.1 polyketide synthase [Alternaria brassicicola]
MPIFYESSSDASDAAPEFDLRNACQRIVTDDEYVVSSSTEPPLSQQLEPIAVVGMGCRLPGDVSSPSDFWRLMMEKRSGQTPKVPSSRFNIDAHFHPDNDRPGSFHVYGGYFINETLQEFDPAFFGITPVEATWMDPQQRKLLEVVYEAFESAGLTLDQLSGSDTACFMATFTADFQQMSFKEPSFRHSLAATGVDPGLLSNRVSHVFNLRGPSIVVNTACSSSVYALHNACNALRNHECSAAVVGGSNLILTVDQHMNTAKLGVLSPTSTCHTFNSYANGYGRAEGVGAIYLKRLSDAVKDGDPIRGVIRSSATNNNGRAPAVGITYPGFDGQRNVMMHAYQRSGLDPMLTGYFECHGTGTAIGDPLEVHAVSDVMNANRTEADGPLQMGAVKTNIGHSEAASGLSAVIKAILIAERNIIPPTRGLTDPNPKIDWKGWQINVPTESMTIPKHLPITRISVNSFGYGGTNAHTIIESPNSLLAFPQSYQYSMPGTTTKSKLARGAVKRNRPYLLVFSAHEIGALKRNATAYGRVAANYSLLDLSYTLANHRTRFHSKGMVVTTPASLHEDIVNGSPNLVLAHKKETATTLGFVFTGQGAQWARMGAQLMAYYPTFLTSIRRMDLALEDLNDAPSWTLEEVILQDSATSCVGEAEFSQPLCTAIQVALVQLFRLWGIQPSVTIGHSSGEIGAAFAAGYISEAEAIWIAYYRGQVVKNIDSVGAMMAVGLGAEAVAPYVESYEPEVVIACHNSPSGVTLSGSVEILKSIEGTLQAEGIFARLVKTNGKAYHSRHMLPAVERYESLIGKARQATTQKHVSSKTKMVSSVTNSVLADDAVLDEKYWSANLVSPVLFNQAVQTALKCKEVPEVDILIEIGPHSALSGPLRQIKTYLHADKLQYLPTLVRGFPCANQVLKLAGELFLRNYPLDLARVTAIEEVYPSGKIIPRMGNLIVDLPPYQWDKTKRYWAESRESKEQRSPRFPRHDVLGQLTTGASLAEPTWRNILRIKDLPWLRDHSLGGEAVFPAAGYLSMAMEAVTQINEMTEKPCKITSYVFRDIVIQQALVTPDDDNGIEVLLNMHPSRINTDDSGKQWWDFNVSSVSIEGHRKNHMAGSIAIRTSARSGLARKVPNLPQRASGRLWNHALKKVGFNYGPTFQDMDNITFDGSTYCAHASTNVKTAVMNDESRHVLHPAIVDSCLQLMIVAIWAGRASAMQFGAVPVRAEEIVIWKPKATHLTEGARATMFSWIDPRGQRLFNAHSQLVAEDRTVLMEIKNMRCIAYEAAIPQKLEAPIQPRPYSQLVYKPDVLWVHNTQTHLDVATFVELAEFKTPGLRVLVTDLMVAQSLIAKFPGIPMTLANRDVKEAEAEADPSGVKKFSLMSLDLTASLATQSYEKLKNSFDVVIAPNILSNSLECIAELLVEGGQAVLGVNGSTIVHDLEKAGLSGPVFSMKDTMFVTSKVRESDKPVSILVQLIYRHNPTEDITRLRLHLEETGFRSRISKLGDPCPPGSNVIMLADLEDPLVATMSEPEFQHLQTLLSDSANVLWVSCGDYLGAGIDPEAAMTLGLLRTLRSERASLKATFVDFVRTDLASEEFLSRTTSLAIALFDDEKKLETEYIARDGQLLLSRLIPAEEVNKTHGKIGRETKPQPFDPKAELVGRIQAGKVVFETALLDKPPLQQDEIEFRQLATGFNLEDQAAITGASFETDFSHETTGIVTKIGSAITKVSVGDKIVAFSASRFSTYQRVAECLVQVLGPEEPYTTIAGLPMYYGAALYGLETLARLQYQESVFILPGSGLLGAAAIWIARALHCLPYVVVRDSAEAEHVATTFSLPSAQILTEYRPEQLVDLDIDVVFSGSSVEPAVAREAWRHTPAFSRFVNCTAAASTSPLDSIPASRGASYLSVNFPRLFQKPRVLGTLLERIMVLYRQGSIPAPSITVRNITELNESIHSFVDSICDNKIVIAHQTSEGLVDIVESRPRLSLPPDATYLLVGCLGGLGRSLTSWMMKHGARNFAFLSRSGMDSEQAAILVNNLETRGANVQVFRGDATVKEDVEEAVRSIPADRPLRGVVHAAMVLRDGLFQNMAYENWTTSIRPKVLGSKHLTEVVADLNLDFFLMMSSVSGILGTPGQANYAAGNSYMDALARLRRSQGKPACAVVLPMILGVGVVAQNDGLEDSLKRKGMYGIDEEALLDSFEAAIIEQRPQTCQQNEALDHLIVGLDPAGLHKARQEAEGDVDAFWSADPRFSSLVHSMNVYGGGNQGGDGEAGSILTRLRAAGTESPAKAVDLVRDHFIAKLARILLVDEAEFGGDDNAERSIASYGVDSMIGAELRNWIFKDLGLDIAFQQLLSPSLTISKFSELVCGAQGIVVEQKV